MNARASHPRRGGRRREWNFQRSGPWIGIAGLFVNLWLTISSVLYAPWWGMVLLLAYLVPQAVLVKRWVRTQPIRCIAVPLAGAAVWALTVVIGAQWWGWSL